jgi:hypothetical protein
MTRFAALLLSAAVLLPLACEAQQKASSLPDAPDPIQSDHKSVNLTYSPPTQKQRFKTYIRHTYSLTSLVEAGVRGGIEQARDNPSQWPEGAEGYGERYGSAMGKIIVRGTTDYLVADLFREDLRYVRCVSPCPKSKFKLALEDSFLARKGENGHEALSVAHLVGPFSGELVANNTWYPGGLGRLETVRGAALTYGLVYVRNLIREAFRH